MKKIIGTLCITCAFLSSCTGDSENMEKTFVYGTTAYSVANADVGLNPHDEYSGWSSVRYGVGETLFKFSDTMEIKPWLATKFELLDEKTWKITLRENVFFSSGRLFDAQAVKECFENLVSQHDRAPYDLQIEEIVADKNILIIKTKHPVPALINYLSDPYAAIIDMQAGVSKDENVSGTGPFVAQTVSPTEIYLKKNEKYWGGEVKTDSVLVKSITDGDTLTLALQSGEIDAAQGLPYAAIPIFSENDEYKISSSDTSRTFFVQVNNKNPILTDKVLRQAMAMTFDKKGFTEVLLKGNGSAAIGPFPSKISEKYMLGTKYNITKANELLDEAGYIDSDGDGYREVNNKKISFNWVSYPSRQELPLLAQMAQDSFKKIGLELNLNVSANHLDFIKSGDWDLYASAFVSMPTGDTQYFFTTHALKQASKNRGGFYNEAIEELNKKMLHTFDNQERMDLGHQMAKILVDEAEFMFISQLKMSLVMKKNVSGFSAHPSDYYEITADLEISR